MNKITKYFNDFFKAPEEGTIEMDKTNCTHQWELTAKTYAPPVRPITNVLQDLKILEKALFGVTTCVWQCAKCGDIRKEEMMGTDESQLLDILEKVDRAGGQAQYIKENNKVYVVMEWVPPARATLPAEVKT